jgi:RNA polymerase sigma-70 factor (ECF subfamily)
MTFQLIIFTGSKLSFVLMTRDTFESLINSLSRNLFGFAYRILREREASEDAVQEIFIKLWKMKSKLGEYKSVEALAVTMIRNHCIDQLRKRKYNAPGENNKLSHFHDSGPSPQEQLETSETMVIMENIISELPEIFRQVVKLRDIEELTYEEIAEKTGQNINTLRVNLSRARKIIREKYKGYYNESRGNKTIA